MNYPTYESAQDRASVIADMQSEVVDFCVSKGWSGPGSAPVTFGDTMALLHSEVSEALEAYRDHKLADATAEPLHAFGCALSDHRVYGMPGDPPACSCGALAKPEGVGSEFADIFIRLLDDCDRWGVDLAAEFERKMAYNRTRAYQHGGRVL